MESTVVSYVLDTSVSTRKVTGGTQSHQNELRVLASPQPPSAIEQQDHGFSKPIQKYKRYTELRKTSLRNSSSIRPGLWMLLNIYRTAWKQSSHGPIHTFLYKAKMDFSQTQWPSWPSAVQMRSDSRRNSPGSKKRRFASILSEWPKNGDVAQGEGWRA